MTIRAQKSHNQRREQLVSTKEPRRRGTISNPMTTSMMDVLGCGFAAVIFLFLIFSASERALLSMAALNEPLDAGALGRSDVMFTAGANAPLLVRISSALAQSLSLPDLAAVGEQETVLLLADQTVLRRGYRLTLKPGAAMPPSSTIIFQLGDRSVLVSLEGALPLADRVLLTVRVATSFRIELNSDFPYVYELYPVPERFDTSLVEPGANQPSRDQYFARIYRAFAAAPTPLRNSVSERVAGLRVVYRVQGVVRPPVEAMCDRQGNASRAMAVVVQIEAASSSLSTSCSPNS